MSTSPRIVINIARGQLDLDGASLRHQDVDMSRIRR
jgi:hypothetical protein